MSFWTADDTTQAALAAKATGFNCLNYTRGFATEGSLEYHYLRNKTYLDAECLDGVRFELMFPSCWNGDDLDSPDHQSHILYPEFIKTGSCPDGFQVRTPVLLYETIWDTYQFKTYAGNFIIANGDPEGYGYHGDFMAAWPDTLLQEAVDVCNNMTGLEQDCPLFDIQDSLGATGCQFDLPDPLENEDTIGPLNCLPGDVPIQYGPENAAERAGTPLASFETPSIIAAAPSSSNGTAPGSPDEAQSTGSVSVVATSTLRTGGIEVDLVIIEEIVTISVTDSPADAKRHPHSNHHRHGH